MSHCDRPQPRSDWANTEDNIPKQDESYAATSAVRLRSNELHVKFPPGLDSQRCERKIKVALHAQTRLIQDAYSAVNEITVLHDDDRLYRLVKAEEAELLASGGEGKCEADALPPRAFAVTLLLSGKTPNPNMALDAASFLARVGPPEQPEKRCVRSVRVSLLTGKVARSYSATCMRQAVTTRYNPLTTVQVCVRWIENRHVPSEDLAGKACQIRSEFCDIEYSQTALDYLNAIRAAISRTLAECKIAVEGSCASLKSINATRHLFTSMDPEPEDVSGAYEAGVAETNLDFWNLLVHKSPERLSSALVGRESDEFLCFDEEKIFLKLAPRGKELDHPEVFHGLLLYKKGMHREAVEHCVESMKEERKPQPNRHPNAPWGLRPPQSHAAEELWLHVLSLHAEPVSLCDVVSGYGLDAVPGKRLTREQGSLMPRLIYRLEPCDAVFLSATFALPCKQELIDSRQPDTWEPIWLATEDAIKAYLHLFPPDYDGPWKDDPTHGEESVRKASPFSLTKHVSPPTGEDVLMRSLLGMPFGVEAFRLGDLHAEVERLQHSPHLASFLIAAIHELGPDASIAQAFDKLTRLCTTHKSEVTSLNKTIETLKQSADVARADADSARKRLKVVQEEAVEKATAPFDAVGVAGSVEEPPEVWDSACNMMACYTDRAEVILRAVGKTAISMFPLKQPLKKGRIVAIVRAYGSAANVQVADDVAAWPKTNATGEHFTAFDTVARTLAHCCNVVEDGVRPMVLMQTGKEVYFFELNCIDGEFVQEAVAPINALRPDRAKLAWLLWNDNESTLTPYGDASSAQN
jgi:hypothetical protein